MDGFADALGSMIAGMMIFAIVVTAIIVAALTYGLTRYFTPTHEDVVRKQERQAVIQQLTPEQLKALGLEREAAQ